MTQSDYYHEKYDISLDTWLADRREGLSSFAAWWEKQNAIDPTRFPLKMLAGDWDEQIELWGSAAVAPAKAEGR